VSRLESNPEGTDLLSWALRGMRRAGAYYCLIVLRAVVIALPEALAHALFRFIADLAFITVGEHRRRAIEHLRIAFPDMSHERARLIAKRTTRNPARNAVEFIRFPTLSKERILAMVTIEGREIVEEIAREGRGAIALTAHLGNWELFGAAVSALGLKMTAVARRIYYNRFEDLLRATRRRAGVHVAYRDEPRSLLRALRDGRFLGILGDMDIVKLDSVYVEFFGRLALTPVGPVALALRTGRPLVPAFIVRDERGAHKIIIQPPLHLVRTGDTQKDLLINTMRATAIIERMVRQYPDQWVWMHRRWQHQPEWPFIQEPNPK